MSKKRKCPAGKGRGSKKSLFSTNKYSRNGDVPPTGLKTVGPAEFFDFAGRLQRRGIEHVTIFAIPPDHREAVSETLYLWQKQAICDFVNSAGPTNGFARTGTPTSPTIRATKTCQGW